MWTKLFSFYFVLILTGVVAADFEEFDGPTINQPSQYMATIFKDKKPLCAGTFIGETTYNLLIATAANCVYKISPSRLMIQLGSTVLDQNSSPVDKVMIHPYYSSFNYDIALLKIEKKKALKFWEFNFEEDTTTTATTTTTTETPSPIKVPLKLHKQPVPLKEQITINGWNKTTTNTAFSSLDGSLENKVVCQTKLTNHLKVTAKMTCVNFSEGATDLIPRGSPMIYKGNLAGIASFRVSGNITLPKIYTNIANSEIYSFIDKYL